MLEIGHQQTITSKNDNSVKCHALTKPTGREENVGHLLFVYIHTVLRGLIRQRKPV